MLKSVRYKRKQPRSTRDASGRFADKRGNGTPSLPGISIAKDKTTHKLELFHTGATRSVLKRRWSLIPVEALAYIADRFSVGAPIHGDHNWKRGLPIDKIVDHIQEHWHAFISHRPDIHDDRSITHLAAMAWGLVVLLYYAHHKTRYADLWTTWWAGQDVPPA